jgi:hypothetical protein
MRRAAFLLLAVAGAAAACRAATAPQGGPGAASNPVEPVRDVPAATASGEAAARIVDAGVVVATPGDAGEPEAAARCVTPRWRIESRHWGGIGGGGRAEVLCDDGSFEERSAGGSFLAHASAVQAHDAHALLVEMRQRGQLSRNIASPPPEPLQCADDCIHSQIDVTLDGVQYVVDLGAKDAADPGPSIGFLTWPNQRALRLTSLLQSVGAPHEGHVTVTGKLASKVVQRIVLQNFGRFNGCYRNALRDGVPRRSGTVTVRFGIDRSGAVSSAAQERGPTELEDAAVVACVVHGFEGLSFPAPEEGTVVVVYELVYPPT